MQKRIVITGVTSGIGKALFLFFLEKGEEVIGIARNPERIEALKANLGHTGYALYQSDFSKVDAIRSVIAKITDDYPDGIDVLINNAAIVPKKKIITADDHELQFQVNHLAVVIMTHGLLPLLKKRKGRVITTGSDAHQRANFDANDLEARKHYHALRSYARTKLYNLMFTIDFNATFAEANGVHAYCVHPGRVRTEIGTKHTSRLYALMWKLFTRKGFDPSHTVHTYSVLVYDLKAEGAHPYYYLAEPHAYASIAGDTDTIRALMDETHAILGIPR